MDRVFLTGGSGFIGSHLAEALLAKGHEVTIYDVKKPENNKARYIQGDIMDYRLLKSSMRGHKTVCHLAAMVGVVACLSDEKEVYRINYDGVKNIINACKEVGAENLLFTSSSEVYGEGGRFRQLEENMELSPITHYGKSKMYSEQLLKEFSEESGIKVTVLRYCNIYGSRQRKEFVISIFLDRLLQGKPIKICGDGEQIRSFTYIDDAVEGTIKALFRKEREYDIFNIGSNQTVKINELAMKIIELNRSGEVKYVSFEDLNRRSECEILIRVPSIEKAKNKLGHAPVMTLDEGLAVTYDYYRNIIGKEPVIAAMG